jgi:hypothetical protein
MRTLFLVIGLLWPLMASADEPTLPARCKELLSGIQAQEREARAVISRTEPELATRLGFIDFADALKAFAVKLTACSKE